METALINVEDQLATLADDEPSRAIADVRPDLQQDSGLWIRLLELTAADAHDPEGLFGALLGMRASGCRLVIVGGKVVMRPGAEWEQPERYVYYRDKYIAPHRDAAVRALTELTRETNNTTGLGDGAIEAA
ncbi:MAG: hypothetical protein ACYDGR_09825 [Candidatus Dormibacteria bacterium]